MKMPKRKSFRGMYEKSIDGITKRILSQNPPQKKEIDIQEHYERSTRTLGEYVTLDWEHRRDIRRLIMTISDYSNDATRKRPLNIIMLAEPGSGKSHFIKCLAQKMSSKNLSAVTFNMTALQNIDDLIQPLGAVRNLKVLDRLPLLFLDEFDSKPSNYSLLLPLLWDGELHLSHRDIKLGKVVIIMAGSDPETKKVMKAAKSMQKVPVNGQPHQNDTQKKLVDLLSRINGGVLEIPGLDDVKKSRDRRVDKICISVSLLQQRFGLDLQLVPWALLRFIALSKFRYGVRSIAHLIDLIPLSGNISNKLLCSDLELPIKSETELKNSSLAYHLVTEEEPEAIIELWKDSTSCNSLVRFNSEPEEEEI